MISERRPRVAYLRGYFLGRSETDYVARVAPDFEVTALTSRFGRFDLTGAPMPIERIKALEDLYQYLPPSLVRYPQFVLGKVVGFDGVFFGLRKALAGYDVVNTAESLFFFSYQAARLKRALGFRLVVLQHDVFPGTRDYSPLVRHMRKVVHEAADLFLARTERARDALLLEGVEPERIRVIPHGVDSTMFRPRPPDAGYRARLGAPGRQPLVLFIGRLTWEKGVLTLVQAIRLLQDDPAIRRRDVRFALVGRGRERRTVERMIDRLGIRRQVRLLPSVPFEEMPDLFSAADLFVLPSIASRRVSEQFGHVLLQSMACGRPVVCTDCGPMLEVVGDAAVTVPQNDAHALADGLRRVLLDDGLRAGLVARGHQRVAERFSADRVAGRLRQLYREVLGMAEPAAAPSPARRLPQPTT